MQIAVRIWRTVVVDDNVYSLNVNATTENVGSNQNTLFKCLKRGVTLDTITIL